MLQYNNYRLDLQSDKECNDELIVQNYEQSRITC